MLSKGLYQITAYVTIRNAVEVAGPDEAAVIVKKFDLKVCSNSIVIRRTATGFTAMDTVAGI